MKKMYNPDFFISHFNKMGVRVFSNEEIRNFTTEVFLFGSANRYIIMKDKYKFHLDEIEFGVEKMGISFCEDGILMGLGSASAYSVQKFNYNSNFEFNGSNLIGQLFFSVNGVKYQFVSGSSQFLRDLIDKLNEYNSLLKDHLSLISSEKQRIYNDNLALSKQTLSKNLDKNNDNTIDLIEGIQEYDILIKKHQLLIQEIGMETLQKMVKLSLFLKTKRSNLQFVYSKLLETDSQSQFNDLNEYLKTEIVFYNKISISSLLLIHYLTIRDLISFFGLYEDFDKLGVFNSAHENKVQSVLMEIDDNIGLLCERISEMSSEISYGFNNLSSSLSELSSSLSDELSSINSTINVNTLITYLEKNN